MRRGVLVASLAIGSIQSALATEAAPDFQKEVLPLLSDRCFTCHGPDEATREAGLRLDQRDGAVAELDSGAFAVKPGEPDASELLARVASEDADVRMPPPEVGPPLSADQVALLRRWVAAGAPYERHWGFVPPQRPAVPEVKNAPWTRNEVDRFVAARLEAEGLAPSPEASQETLLRRLSLDLIGLPPTIEEIDAFLADQSPGAYERQVERLLASPHYGERWGRLWLDAARYADSDGYEKDLPREVWAYRDWVVEALNADTPYDRFVKLQVAGDLLPGAGDRGVVATGFLRNSTINEEGGIDPEEFRVAGTFERMDILGKAVLGLTVNCAQCHDHKFDPFPHRDYFRLFAFLNDAEEVSVAAYTPEEEPARRAALAEVARIEEGLKRSAPNWERRLGEWAARLSAERGVAWKSFRVENIADHARRYLYHDDLSVTNWGYNPPNTTPEFAGSPGPGKIAAIRLEALTDPINPLGGPGRSPRGLFALTELVVEVLPVEGEPRKVKLAAATADFGNEPMLLETRYEDPANHQHRVTGPVSYAIDGLERTAWGIDRGPARSNVDRQAVFVLAEPLELAEGERLKFSMQHFHGGYNPDDRVANTIGRFRFSVTDDATAKADPVPAKVRRLAAKEFGDWTLRERDAAFSYWRTTVPDWEEPNKAIEAAWRRHPRGATQLALGTRPGGRATHVLERGEFLKPLERVEPGVPEALHPLPPGARPDRVGLADWLTSPDSPTTARSIVNRVWQAYFGQGLVETTDDFGTQGSRPSHPELLDWLAVELVARDWRLKDLHRLVVTSATYRQSSAVTPELRERDPRNVLLARGARVRLDGELVRDVSLVASGTLDARRGGPPVFPPAPAFLFQPPASFGPKVWEESTGGERRRRGLYTFRFRSVPHPVLGVFDTPAGDSPCVRRNRSNTPLQALALLNEPSFLESARGLAMSVLRGAPDDTGRVTEAFRRCVGRRPTDEEHAEALALLASFEAKFSAAQSDALLLASADPARPPLLPDGATLADAAAWTAMGRVLLSLDETITKE